MKKRKKDRISYKLNRNEFENDVFFGVIESEFYGPEFKR